MRTNATEIGDARRRVETLVSALPSRGDGDLAFEEPWEIRAFAIAVVAHEAGLYEWAEFQLSLIAAIREWEALGRDPDTEPWNYYRRWLAALENVLSGSGLLSKAALDERTKEVLAKPANRDHHGPHREPVAVDRATRS